MLRSLRIKNLAPHRGRFIGVGAVDEVALATVRKQLPQWLGNGVPEKARDFGIAHWRTRHIPECTTMAATSENEAVKLGMWKRDDRIVLSVYNGGDKNTNAEISLNMLYLGLTKRLLWQEFVRAAALHGDSKVTFDYYNNKDGIDAKKKRNQDMARIRNTYHISTHHSLMLVEFESNYRMGGYICSQILYGDEGNQRYTVVTVNQRNGRLSMRGDMCNFYAGVLRNLGYVNVDGHGVAMGGSVEKKKLKMLKYDLHSIINQWVEKHQLWKVI